MTKTRPHAFRRTISRSVDVPRSADHAWSVIRDVAGIASWLPGAKFSHLEGDIRTVVFQDGGEVVERIVSIDDSARRYAYRLLRGRLPLTTYEAQFRVTPITRDRSATIEWSGSFVSHDPDDELADVLVGMYDAGLDALARMLVDSPQNAGKEQD